MSFNSFFFFFNVFVLLYVYYADHAFVSKEYKNMQLIQLFHDLTLNNDTCAYFRFEYKVHVFSQSS